MVSMGDLVKEVMDSASEESEVHLTESQYIKRMLENVQETFNLQDISETNDNALTFQRMIGSVLKRLYNKTKFYEDDGELARDSKGSVDLVKLREEVLSKAADVVRFLDTRQCPGCGWSQAEYGNIYVRSVSKQFARILCHECGWEA